MITIAVREDSCSPHRANILTLPKISESLAGRMEIVTLLPPPSSKGARMDRRRVMALMAASFFLFETDPISSWITGQPGSPQVS